MDYGMLHYLPSHIAASIVLVALHMLDKPAWSSTLQYYSKYSPADLKRCAQVVHFVPQHCFVVVLAEQCLPALLNMQAVHSLFIQAKTSSLPASREKYASSKFATVSQLGSAEHLPDWLFV